MVLQGYRYDNGFFVNDILYMLVLYANGMACFE